MGKLDRQTELFKIITDAVAELKTLEQGDVDPICQLKNELRELKGSIVKRVQDLKLGQEVLWKFTNTKGIIISVGWKGEHSHPVDTWFKVRWEDGAVNCYAQEDIDPESPTVLLVCV